MSNRIRSRDSVLQATHLAIGHAKQRRCAVVEPDDLLLGLLGAVSRFGVTQIGEWAIDLEQLDGHRAEVSAGDGVEPRDVAYSEATAEIFDRAAAIARQDGAQGVTPVHLLVAFGEQENGLMQRLREELGFDSLAWRAALAREARAPSSAVATDQQPSGAETGSKELLSPDEAAELLGVHTQTVRGYIRSGKLPAFRVAGERAIRIKRWDVFALLESVRTEDNATPQTSGREP